MAHITTLTKAHSANTGTANTFSYSGSFDVFKASEVIVKLDDVALTFKSSIDNESASPRQYSVDVSAKTIHIGGADLSSGTVTIYPKTDMGNPTGHATFSPGSSIDSADLNNNQKQALRKLMELDEQKRSTLVDVPAADIADGTARQLLQTNAAGDSTEWTSNVDIPGTLDVTGAVDFDSTLTVDGTSTLTGNVTVGGTVDGRDIAADGTKLDGITSGATPKRTVEEIEDIVGGMLTGNTETGITVTYEDGDGTIDFVVASQTANDFTNTLKNKLDGIEASADVTDATNVNSAGAIMNSDLDGKGELLVGDGTGDPSALAVGSNGQFLKANSSATTGVEWTSNVDIPGTLDVTGATVLDSTLNVSGTITGDVTGNLTGTASKVTVATNSTEAANHWLTFVDGTIGSTSSQDLEIDTDLKYTPNSNMLTTNITGNVTGNATGSSGSCTGNAATATDLVAAAKVTNSEQASHSADDSTYFTTSASDARYFTHSAVDAKGDILTGTADNAIARTAVGSDGKFLKADSGASGGVSWDTVTQTDTTYTHTWQDSSDNAILRLTAGGSGSGNDDLTIVAGSNITLTPSGDNLTIAASGGEITVQDEGSALSTAATTLNFVGAGVVASGTGAAKTITISGAGGANATDFKYLELKAHNNTSGSFSAGSADYELVTAGTTTAISPDAANALLISVGGVIQQPNTGTSIGSNNGFCIDGSSIHFGGNLAEHPDFIIYLSGGIIATPSDNSVTAAKTDISIVAGDIIFGNGTDSWTRLAKGTAGQVLKMNSGATAPEWGTDSGGISNIVEDTSPQLGGDLDTNSFEILLDDDHKVKFGASNDLTIHHAGAGANKIISASPHTMYIASDQTQITNTAIDEACGKFIANGAVELYYDNAKKLSTTANGVKLEGSNLWAPDNVKINIGQGDDLQIYHNGTNSYINNATGALAITGDDLNFENAARNETYAEMDNGGAVKLYYDNAKKFETTSLGTRVSHSNTNATASSWGGSTISIKNTHDTDNNSSVIWFENSAGGVDSAIQGIHEDAAGTSSARRGHIQFGTSGSDSSGSCIERLRITGDGKVRVPDNGKFVAGAGDDLQLFHNGTNSQIENSQGDLNIKSDVLRFRAANDEQYITAIANGAVELYYDNAKKFETTSGGGKLTGDWFMTSGGYLSFPDSVQAIFGTGDDLRIYHNGSHSYIDEAGTGDLYIRSASNIRLTDTSDNKMILCQDGGEVQLYYDGTEKAHTTATGLRLDDSDTLEIGTSADLQIYHDGTDNRIKGITGQIIIQSNDLLLRNQDSDETYARCQDNGSVELYYDNSKKLETTSTGLQCNDDVKFKFGTGGDLEIFHNASNGNKIMSNNMDIRIGTNQNHTLILGQYYDAVGGGDTCEIWSSGVMPAVNDNKDLGETNHKWDDIYATNSTIQTSDRNDKENITASDLGLSFINKLSPKSYKFKGKTRTHYGLVSQDVETVLGDISKPTSGFAGFIKTDSSEAKDGSSYNYGLRYGEFIGPLVKAVQELSAEVETLKTKVAALEAG